jgi:hypothetical protein
VAKGLRNWRAWRPGWPAAHASFTSWDGLHGKFEINHEEAYSMDGALNELGGICSATRKRLHGVRTIAGDQVTRLAGLALHREPSLDFAEYWQRTKAA